MTIVHFARLLMICVPPALALGCQGQEQGSFKEAKTMITPEEARAALIEMIEEDYDKLLPPLQRELDVLKKEPVVFLDNTNFRIGNLHCNQTDFSFVFTFHNPHIMLEYDGMFVMGADRKWKAMITRMSQGRLR